MRENTEFAIREYIDGVVRQNSSGFGSYTETAPSKTKFKELCSPLEIRGLRFKNRMVRSGMYEAMATESGEVTPQLEWWLATMAAGGAAVVFPGYTNVCLPRCMTYQTGSYSDRHIAGLTRAAEAIHRNGAVAGLHLAAAGRQANPKLFFSDEECAMGPSAMGPDPLFKTPCREMTEKEIWKAIEDMALPGGGQLYVGDGHILLRQGFRREFPGSGGPAAGAFFPQQVQLAAQLGEEGELAPPGGEAEEDPGQQGLRSGAALHSAQTVGDIVALDQFGFHGSVCSFPSGAAGGADKAVDEEAAVHPRGAGELDVALDLQIPLQPDGAF